jgi:hypothetical protein
MPTSKPWYQSKTILFNALTIVIAVAAYFGFTPDQAVTLQVSTFLVALSPVVNLVLRFFTTQPVASSATE